MKQTNDAVQPSNGAAGTAHLIPDTLIQYIDMQVHTTRPNQVFNVSFSVKLDQGDLKAWFWLAVTSVTARHIVARTRGPVPLPKSGWLKESPPGLCLSAKRRRKRSPGARTSCHFPRSDPRLDPQVKQNGQTKALQTSIGMAEFG